MPGPFGRPQPVETDLGADIGLGYQQNAANKIAQARVQERKGYTSAYGKKYGLSNVPASVKGKSDTDLYEMASSLVQKRRGPVKVTPAPAKKAPAPTKKAPAPTKKAPAPAKKAPTPAKKRPARRPRRPAARRTSPVIRGAPKRPPRRRRTPATTTAPRVTVSAGKIAQLSRLL